MISAQVHFDSGEALDRLKIRSAAQGQTLDEATLDVRDGVVRFDA